MGWRSNKAFGLPPRPLSKTEKSHPPPCARSAPIFFLWAEIFKQSNRYLPNRKKGPCTRSATKTIEFLQRPWAGPDQGPMPKALGRAGLRTRASGGQCSSYETLRTTKFETCRVTYHEAPVRASGKDIAQGQVALIDPT